MRNYQRDILIGNTTTLLCLSYKESNVKYFLEVYNLMEYRSLRSRVIFLFNSIRIFNSISCFVETCSHFFSGSAHKHILKLSYC